MAPSSDSSACLGPGRSPPPPRWTRPRPRCPDGPCSLTVGYCQRFLHLLRPPPPGRPSQCWSCQVWTSPCPRSPTPLASLRPLLRPTAHAQWPRSPDTGGWAQTRSRESARCTPRYSKPQSAQVSDSIRTPGQFMILLTRVGKNDIRFFSPPVFEHIFDKVSDLFDSSSGHSLTWFNIY